MSEVDTIRREIAEIEGWKPWPDTPNWQLLTALANDLIARKEAQIQEILESHHNHPLA